MEIKPGIAAVGAIAMEILVEFQCTLTGKSDIYGCSRRDGKVRFEVRCMQSKAMRDLQQLYN